MKLVILQCFSLHDKFFQPLLVFSKVRIFDDFLLWKATYQINAWIFLKVFREGHADAVSVICSLAISLLTQFWQELDGVPAKIFVPLLEATF